MGRAGTRIVCVWVVTSPGDGVTPHILRWLRDVSRNGSTMYSYHASSTLPLHGDLSSTPEADSLAIVAHDFKEWVDCWRVSCREYTHIEGAINSTEARIRMNPHNWALYNQLLPALNGGQITFYDPTKFYKYKFAVSRYATYLTSTFFLDRKTKQWREAHMQQKPPHGKTVDTLHYTADSNSSVTTMGTQRNASNRGHSSTRTISGKLDATSIKTVCVWIVATPGDGITPRELRSFKDSNRNATTLFSYQVSKTLPMHGDRSTTPEADSLAILTHNFAEWVECWKVGALEYTHIEGAIFCAEHSVRTHNHNWAIYQKILPVLNGGLISFIDPIDCPKYRLAAIRYANYLTRTNFRDRKTKEWREAHMPKIKAQQEFIQEVRQYAVLDATGGGVDDVLGFISTGSEGNSNTHRSPEDAVAPWTPGRPRPQLHNPPRDSDYEQNPPQSESVFTNGATEDHQKGTGALNDDYTSNGNELLQEILNNARGTGGGDMNLNSPKGSPKETGADKNVVKDHINTNNRSHEVPQPKDPSKEGTQTTGNVSSVSPEKVRQVVSNPPETRDREMSNASNTGPKETDVLGNTTTDSALTGLSETTDKIDDSGRNKTLGSDLGGNYVLPQPPTPPNLTTTATSTTPFSDPMPSHFPTTARNPLTGLPEPPKIAFKIPIKSASKRHAIAEILTPDELEEKKKQIRNGFNPANL